MPRYIYTQTNFKYGMLGDRLHRRSDLPEYSGGAAIMENMVPTQQGGARKRPGTKHLFEATGFSNGNLARFLVDNDEGYVVGVPDSGSSVYVYDLEGNAQTVNNTANISGSGMSYCQIGDILIFAHIGGQPVALRRDPDAGDFHLEYIFDPSKSNRLSSDIVGYDQLLLPMLDANVDGAKNLRPSATSGSITLYAEDGGGTPISLFSSSHVGAFFKITHASATGICRITAYTSASQVTATVMTTFGATTRSDNWEESAWSDFQGWPQTVTYFENRLIFGGAGKNPDTLYGSRVGSIFHFMAKRFAQDSSSDSTGFNYFGSVAETDPIGFTISSNIPSRIMWLNSGPTLQIGTQMAEYAATGGSERILSALNVSFTRQTSHGSAYNMPMQVENDIYYVSRTERDIRNFFYNDANNAYNSNNMSTLNDNILSYIPRKNFSSYVGGPGYIKNIQYQENKDTIWMISSAAFNGLVAATESRDLIGVTVSKSKKQLGWSAHQLGGSSSGAAILPPRVHDICTIPDYSPGDGIADSVFILTQRVIDGNNKWYVEKLMDDLEVKLNEDVWYVDSGVQKDLATATVNNVNTTTDILTTSAAHNYTHGTRVYFKVVGTYPTPLAADTSYYVRAVTTTTVSLHQTRDDAINNVNKIDITTAGSGTMSFEPKGTTVWDGLTHLEGETVKVYGGQLDENDSNKQGGFYAGEYTVSSGEITADYELRYTTIGLPYTAKLKTLPLFPEINFESAFGVRKRIDRATIKFYRTNHAKIGRDADNLDEIDFKDPDLDMDGDYQFFEGEKEIYIESAADNDGSLYIESDLPLPLEISAISLRGVTHE